jgi:hypothetical protein
MSISHEGTAEKIGIEYSRRVCFLTYRVAPCLRCGGRFGRQRAARCGAVGQKPNSHSVMHSEKHNTTCEGLLMGIFHPAIGQAKNMKLAARALISNREESDFL